MASTPVPPGWYPAPHAGGDLRYWDGEQWGNQPAHATAAGRPVPVSQQPAAARGSTTGGRGWKWAAVGAGTVALLLMVATISLTLANAGAQARIEALENREGSSDAGGQGSPQAGLDVQETEITEPDTGNDSWTTTQLNDGTFEIGVTTEPGVYQTDEIGEYCQWNIYTGDSYTDGIVDFGAGGSAPVTVTLKAGQKFSAVDCGVWIRIG